MHPANERRRYIVFQRRPSLAGRIHKMIPAHTRFPGQPLQFVCPVGLRSDAQSLATCFPYCLCAWVHPAPCPSFGRSQIGEAKTQTQTHTKGASDCGLMPLFPTGLNIILAWISNHGVPSKLMGSWPVCIDSGNEMTRNIPG